MGISPLAALSRNLVFHLTPLIFCLAMVVLPLRADPTPSLDQLTVLDQGSQIIITWHFYYRLLPKKLILPGGSTQITLDDPATLRPNLEALVRSAFALTLDGQPAPLTTLSELNLAPDGGVDATLLYPGRKNARLQVREPLLPLYPSTYIINFEIYSPSARAHAVTGYFTGGAPSPVIDYTQIGDDYKPSIFDALNAPPVKLFKQELRAAWINPSWLFLILIVLLLRPARQLYPLAWIMALAWILPIFIWAHNGTQIPLPLHPLIPALLTAAIAALGLLARPSLAVLAPALACAGLLNGCYEVQKTTLERPPPIGPNLTGLSLGLIAGFALIFAIALPILYECRKHPHFQHAWAPKIAAALALTALALALLR